MPELVKALTVQRVLTQTQPQVIRQEHLVRMVHHTQEMVEVVVLVAEVPMEVLAVTVDQVTTVEPVVGQDQTRRPVAQNLMVQVSHQEEHQMHFISREWQ